MSDAAQTGTGVVASLWRYPIKSMRGEELNSVRVSKQGLFGDRTYALLDNADGKVATAKNPRKWPNLFAFRAALIEPSARSAKVRSLRITLPDGTVLSGNRSDVNQVLSEALHRHVTLAATQGGHVTEAQSSTSPVGIRKAEEYWPDIEGLEFELPRFRPNIVVEPGGGEGTFVENSWIGRTIVIGDQVHLRITEPCGRCVMTTLAQGELPQDSHILRTAVRYNQAHVGVYAAVVRGGTIRCGDSVSVCGI